MLRPLSSLYSSLLMISPLIALQLRTSMVIRLPNDYSYKRSTLWPPSLPLKYSLYQILYINFLKLAIYRIYHFLHFPLPLQTYLPFLSLGLMGHYQNHSLRSKASGLPFRKKSQELHTSHLTSVGSDLIRMTLSCKEGSKMQSLWRD